MDFYSYPLSISYFMKIINIKQKDPVEILGHVFNGLDEINQAVEGRVLIGDTEIIKNDEWKPVAGIHILRFYAPYPCFDASDRMYEKRQYSNYFFSKEPFTEEKVAKLTKLPCQFNYRMVTDDLPEWALPAVYFGGSSWNDLYVAK